MSDLTGQRVFDVTYHAIERRADMVRRDIGDLCKLVRTASAFSHWHNGMADLLSDVEQDITDMHEEVRALQNKIRETCHAA